MYSNLKRVCVFFSLYFRGKVIGNSFPSDWLNIVRSSSRCSSFNNTWSRYLMLENSSKFMRFLPKYFPVNFRHRFGVCAGLDLQHLCHNNSDQIKACTSVVKMNYICFCTVIITYFLIHYYCCKTLIYMNIRIIYESFF